MCCETFFDFVVLWPGVLLMDSEMYIPGYKHKYFLFSFLLYRHRRKEDSYIFKPFLYNTNIPLNWFECLASILFNGKAKHRGKVVFGTQHCVCGYCNLQESFTFRPEKKRLFWVPKQVNWRKFRCETEMQSIWCTRVTTRPSDGLQLVWFCIQFQFLDGHILPKLFNVEQDNLTYMLRTATDTYYEHLQTYFTELSTRFAMRIQQSICSKLKSPTTIIRHSEMIFRWRWIIALKFHFSYDSLKWNILVLYLTIRILLELSCEA